MFGFGLTRMEGHGFTFPGAFGASPAADQIIFKRVTHLKSLRYFT